MALDGRSTHDVTFCVHIKNRRAQLERTLPENLAALRSHENVGLVVLDYNSDDGIAEWIASSFMDEIRSGRLIYGRERTAKLFHASKSKNLAHRIAPGRLLVNLDCDNFIDGTVPLLCEVARSSDNALVHVWSGTHGDGTFGRIAISRPVFFAIGGYDESLLPIGHEDRDLIRRARRAGVDVVSVVGAGFAEGSVFRARALPNTRADSMRYTGSRLGYTTMNRLNRLRSVLGVGLHGGKANAGGWGRAVLEINFERELELV